MKAAVAALLALAALAPLAAPAAPADGCRAEGDATVCQFTADTGASAALDFSWDLPAAPRTLAQITVRFEGQDNGWKLFVRHNGTFVSEAGHAAARGVAVAVKVTDTSDHLLINETTDAWRLTLRPYYVAVGDLQVSAFAPAGRSVGKFTITYVAREVPEGAPPERPAASREHPTLDDVSFDGPEGETDLVAAWFDDAELGDALMDAHLAVRDLRNATLPAGERLRYGLQFNVRDEYYFLIWQLYSASSPGDIQMSCWLGTERLGNSVITMYPSCRLDRDAGEVHAVFPERSLGSPGPGVRFENVVAFASYLGSFTGEVQDLADAERNPFALGGPAVWDGLNGCAFCPLPVEEQWYEDPLSVQHLDTTLQVAGSALAGATFLVGLLVVRRRRVRTRALLDEIDRVERRGEAEPRGALMELGMLESRFTHMFRQGELHESQYQVVSQRIASVATRLALRRELGLDDGTPDGLGPHAVRVPVQGHPDDPRART